MSNPRAQRREIYYSGQVQGVGFRYTTVRIARNYDVVGFVRNLPDGRVHLVVEGASEEIDAFLADIARSMGAYIRDRWMDIQTPTGEFGDFGIRF